MSFEYLTSRTNKNYLLFIRLSKLCLKNHELLPLEMLNVEAGSGENFGLTHVQSAFLYCLESDEVELIIEAAYYFIKNVAKGTIFHVAWFYSTAKSAPTEMRMVYAQKAADTQPCSQLLTAVTLQGQPDSY